jgi:hypothetical protein
LYGVGVAPGDGAPTCTQIIAGQNDGSSAALSTGSDANVGTSDTISVTGTNPIPTMDLYFCLSNSGGNSAVDSSQTDKVRSARSGFAIVTLTSLSATGLADCTDCFAAGTSADSYFTPDMAVGDVFEYEDDTNQNADCNISISAAGDATFTPVVATECDGRLSFEISYEDVSSATTGLFTAPAAGTFASDDTLYVNNTAPGCNDDPTQIILLEDAAMTAYDLDSLCVDVDGDALTYAVVSGTLPAGVILTGATGVLSGTPNTEAETANLIEFTVTDAPGDVEHFFITFYVVNTWTVPDLVGDTVSAAEDEVVTAAPWRADNPDITVSSQTCSASTPGTILTQDPTASSEAAAEAAITVTTAMDCTAGIWVSYSRVWMFREVRKVYLTTTAFKSAVEAELRASATWARWKPGTLAWSGSSNMEIDVSDIPNVPPLTSGGQVAP